MPVLGRAEWGRAAVLRAARRIETAARSQPPQDLGLPACAPRGRAPPAGTGASCSPPSQEDRRGNLFPTKQRDGKIDAAVALLMAIGRAQASESDGAQDVTAFLLNPVMG